MRFCFDGDCCNYCNFLSLLSIALGVVAQSPEPGAHVKNSSPRRKCAGHMKKIVPRGKMCLRLMNVVPLTSFILLLKCLCKLSALTMNA